MNERLLKFFESLAGGFLGALAALVVMWLIARAGI